MTTTLTSNAVGIQFMDNISMQMVWTGSPTGAFAVQGSLDYKQLAPGGVIPPTIENAGTWTAITLSPSPAATGSSGDWLLDLNQLSFPWIRIVYTPVSGSGNLNVTVAGKEV